MCVCVCVCVCVFVCLSEHAILAVRATKCITKDTVVLSIRFAAILKWVFSLNCPIFFSFSFGRSGAGDELDCCGCFSASTRHTAALVSSVAVSPIFMSLADGKELELLKCLRRAMSILTPSAACELERYMWIKYGRAPVRI